jgi:hypothetical protein
MTGMKIRFPFHLNQLYFSAFILLARAYTSRSVEGAQPFYRADMTLISKDRFKEK